VKWDEVEREFYVIGTQLVKLSNSFLALALALQRERLCGNKSGNEGAVRPSEGIKKIGAAEPPLPF